MKAKYSRVFLGFVLGMSVVLALGFARDLKWHGVRVSEDILTSVAYQSTFSGINDDGVCYLAITDTRTGQTDLFKLTEALDGSFNANAFQRGLQGRVIAVPQVRRAAALAHEEAAAAVESR
ncbi:MAG: hypothetical protein ACYSWO_26075 [Planctomycetota bacterium]